MTMLRQLVATYAWRLGSPTLSLRREEGQTLSEYALILALIAVFVIAAVIFLRGAISGLFSDIGSAI
jgi:Flp pilus assembly pilin Flp